MTARDGRQLIERVLVYLNYERAIATDEGDRLALIEASFSCTEIIRNWHKTGLTALAYAKAASLAMRKAAA